VRTRGVLSPTEELRKLTEAVLAHTDALIDIWGPLPDEEYHALRRKLSIIGTKLGMASDSARVALMRFDERATS